MEVGPIRREWRLVLVAVQALTRIPVPAAYGPDILRQASRYFPLVGIGVGLVAAGVFTVAARGLPSLIAALLSLVATLLLTGALHEDGLADTCDGLFGGRTRDDALRIMRDSRIGAFGVLGLGVVVGAKVAILAALPSPFWAIVASHAVSRFWMVATAAALPYARPAGMARGVAAPSGLELGISGGIALAALLPVGPNFGGALLYSTLIAVATIVWVRRQIGGYTGDILGAVQVLTETSVLLAILWHVA